jgi:1-deoxy-D-xylulose-5-phosphate reductoisomerase
VPTIYNAANEYAVAKFLDRQISYLQITQIIEQCMNEIAFCENPDVSQILETQNEVGEWIESRW